MSSTITFEKARKEYDSDNGTVVALAGLDLHIEKGETVCLIGTSGSGKTTALKMVNRLIEPTAGQVLIDDQPVSKYELISLRRKIGYVIQRGGLFPHMTVAENIELLATIEKREPDSTRRKTEELLELVNLPAAEFASRLPKELSGGQQQRVSIARALAFDPEIILMDEPFGALDPITRSELHSEFQTLQHVVDKTTIIVTHDLAEAFVLGDRLVLLDKGEEVQSGRKEDFLERPATEFVEKFVEAHLEGVGE